MAIAESDIPNSLLSSFTDEQAAGEIALGPVRKCIAMDNETIQKHMFTDYKNKFIYLL